MKLTITRAFLCRGIMLMAMSPSTALPAQESNPDQDTPYQLEKLVISAAERREMAIRTIRYGLAQPRSTRPKDAEKIVCDFRRKTGTHLRQLICGTNSAWAHWSEENMSRIANSMSAGNRAVFDSGGRGRTPYKVEPGKFLILENVTRGEVLKWIREVSSDDSDERNAQLLQEHLMARAIGFARSKQGYTVTDLVRYALALKEMRAAESDFETLQDNMTPKQEMQLAEERARIRQAIIESHDLGVATFDGIANEMRSDPVLRTAIERAMKVEM